MHGEYKIPGGKLVVVDLEVIDQRLANVQVSGDFFLEPDEALLALNAGLEGLAVDSTEQFIAERVAEALAGAELLGITAEGVAVAVRRAITGGAA
jgi:lipoate-protein ligase A